MDQPQRVGKKCNAGDACFWCDELEKISHLELEEESSSNSKVSNIHPSLYHQQNAFENHFLKGVLSTI
ncbi:hypothetical protein DB29_02397 [Shouchella clausii]|nr:hypothetical protein DB29_02397 [Shouchella clausii]